jgi:hypothetical protein
MKNGGRSRWSIEMRKHCGGEIVVSIMIIERTRDEIIIRLPSYVDSKGLERLVDFLKYKEATARNQATQGDIDKLARQIKKGWWKKNKPRLVK